jgi:hypothetical protein
VSLVHPQSPPATRPQLALEANPVALEANRGAAALAAASMSPTERRRLRAALDAFTERLETRAHPLADDFDDTPIDAALRDELRTSLPKLTAARALVTGVWRGSYAADEVRAVDGCPERRLCVDPWARGGTDEARRARFLAWPVSAAALLRFDDSHDADAAAARLRARAGARDSRIALVVTADGVDADVARELVAVRTAAARAAALLARSDAEAEPRALLDEVARATLPAPPPWLHLGAGELLIVPRLGAVAALDRFTDEIAAHAPAARFLYRPRALD